MKVKSRNTNLLDGPISGALCRLALPIMATSLIQMAYNFTDMFWVGGLGGAAVAAVGTGGLFNWFADSLMYLARMGGQVRSAQSLGAGDLGQARRYAAAALQLGLLLALVYGATVSLFRKPLVAFFQFSDPETVAMSEDYLLITGGLLVFSFGARIFTGLMTAAGNSRTPFLATTAGLVVNMILDPLLIRGCGWGVRGAAWATVIAQAFVLLLFVLAARREALLRGLEYRRLYRDCYGAIARIGIPAGLQTMFYSGTSIVISRFVASYSDLAVAAQRIGSQIECLSWLAAEGLASALNAFVAQNVGAKQWRRAQVAYRLAALFMIGLAALITAAFLLWPEPIVRIFLHEAEAIAVGASYLRILALSEILMCLELIAYGTFAGYGQTLFPSLLGIIFTALRIPMAALLSSSGLGLDGVWWAITISSCLKGSLLSLALPCYRRRRERREVLELASR